MNDCVSGIGLGESQRGMLDYVLNLQAVPAVDSTAAHCDTLLIDGSTTALPLLTDDWQMVWTGKRSPDAHEQFWLYTRKRSDIDASEVASRRRISKHRTERERHVRRGKNRRRIA